MTKKIIAPLFLNEKEIYSLDDLKKNFSVKGLISIRKRLVHWLNNRAGEEGKEIAKQIEPFGTLKDDEWVKQVSKILGCEEEYKAEKSKLTDEEKRKVTDLIRSPSELTNDEWVELVRKVRYDEVDMSPEELDQYKEAVKKKSSKHTAKKRKKTIKQSTATAKKTTRNKKPGSAKSSNKGNDSKQEENGCKIGIVEEEGSKIGIVDVIKTTAKIIHPELIVFDYFMKRNKK